MFVIHKNVHELTTNININFTNIHKNYTNIHKNYTNIHKNYTSIRLNCTSVLLSYINMDCRTLSSSPTIIFIIRQPNNFTNKVKIGSDATTSVIISSDFLIVRILGNYYSCSLSVTQDSWLSHGLNPLPCPFLPIKTPPNPPSITISMCQLGFCVKARAMPTF